MSLKTPVGRFLDKIAISDFGNGCWNYQGSRRGRMGYGWINIKGQKIAAHRAAWELFWGVIPDGLCVLHRRDNPRCVRPDHLFLGTHLDNAQDRDAKGRNNQPKGEAHPRATITTRLASAIKYENATARKRYGLRKKLARKYGLTVSNIQNIIYGRSWKHA